MNFGSPIAIGFWIAFALGVLYGLSCDVRRAWRHRHDAQRLGAFVTIEDIYELPAYEPPHEQEIA